jgi:UDP-glucose 4-epimerase
MIRLDRMHCLVTGGAGFIGSHLVDQLLTRGCKVRVLDNLSNGKTANISHHFANPNFEFSQGSITDPCDVEEAIQNIQVVFHLACLGVRHSIAHPFENHRVNAEGTLLLLAAARRAKVLRFIHCSSSEVYGSAQYVPMAENHPTHPCTVYGAGKLAGEASARAYHLTYGLPTVIIRPFNTYGPRSHHEGDAGEMIPKSIVRALNGEEILVFGDGLQTRDFTFVEDTAAGLVAAAECEAMTGLTLNIGCNFEISIKDLAEKLVAMVGNTAATVRFTPARPGDVSRLYADPSAFMGLCDWNPATAFEAGLKKTIAYFREHPLGPAGLLHNEAGRNW